MRLSELVHGLPVAVEVGWLLKSAICPTATLSVDHVVAKLNDCINNAANPTATF